MQNVRHCAPIIVHTQQYAAFAFVASCSGLVLVTDQIHNSPLLLSFSGPRLLMNFHIFLFVYFHIKYLFLIFYYPASFLFLFFVFILHCLLARLLWLKTRQEPKLPRRASISRILLSFSLSLRLLSLSHFNAQ